MSSKSKKPKQNKKKQMPKNIAQLDDCQAEEEEKALNIQLAAASTATIEYFEIKNSNDSLINNKNVDTDDLVRSGQITDESFESCQSNDTNKPFQVLNKNYDDSTTDEEVNQSEAIKDTFDQSNSIEAEHIIEQDETDKETIEEEDENDDERSSIEVLNEKNSDDEVEHPSTSSPSDEQYESTTNTNDESLTEELLFESSDEAKTTKISSQIHSLVEVIAENELVTTEEQPTQKQIRKEADDESILNQEQSKELIQEKVYKVDDSLIDENHEPITIESIEKDVNPMENTTSQEIEIEIANEDEEKNVKDQDDMDLIEVQEDEVQIENKNQQIDETVTKLSHSIEETIQEETVISIEQDQEARIIVKEEDETLIMTNNEQEDKVNDSIEETIQEETVISIEQDQEARMTNNEQEEKVNDSVEDEPLINEASELISDESIDSTNYETNRIASTKEISKEEIEDQSVATEKKYEPIQQLKLEEYETENESDESVEENNSIEDDQSQVTDVEFTDDPSEQNDELSSSIEELRDFLLSSEDNENNEIDLINELEEFVQSLSKQPLISNRLEEEIKSQQEEIVAAKPEIEQKFNSSGSNYLVYIMAGVVVAALSFGVTKFAKYKNLD